jgi:hypothetical protein
MKLSKLISEAQELLKEEGDLELFTESTSEVTGLSVEVSDGQFPRDWKMPKGYKFVTLSDFS